MSWHPPWHLPLPYPSPLTAEQGDRWTMLNKGSRATKSIHGKDPQALIEKILRERIYECRYWKEECFGLTSETVLDKAVGLEYIGGTFGNQRPVPFICLILRLLQIQPSKEIILEFLRQQDFKYLRAIAAYYWRLIGSSKEVYLELENLLADCRKLRVRKRDGKFELTTMDQFVDDLLREERVFEVILPRLPRRHVLEDNDELEPRESKVMLDPVMLDPTMLDPTMLDPAMLDPTLQTSQFESQPTTAAFAADEKGAFKESISLEETNALRIKLGLRPLVP